MFENFIFALKAPVRIVPKAVQMHRWTGVPFSYNFQLVISSDAFSLINYEEKEKRSLTRRKKESEEKFK